MEPMENKKQKLAALSDRKLEKVTGGAGGEESPASVLCNHCGGTASRSSDGWLGYTLYDCSCGWRTKYKGNEWVACYDPAASFCCP